MIDTHCHLTHPRLAADLEQVVTRARESGLDACITIGTGLDDAQRAAELARRHAGFVFCSGGIDPFSAHSAGERFDDELQGLGELLPAAGFHALGEIGLDYHYDLDPRPLQAARFERQLDLARQLDLPVVIHVREAHEDLIAILGSHPDNLGVIHSFTAGPAEAERYLQLGWSLAFNGVLTFKSAREVREAARMVPLERLLVETDSPYLAPVPYRGRRCEPAHVRHTLSCLARLRGESEDRLGELTAENARSLFRLGARPG